MKRTISIASKLSLFIISLCLVMACGGKKTDSSESDNDTTYKGSTVMTALIGNQKPESVQEAPVVSYLHYCEMAVARIYHYKSVVVLDHESDELKSNLKLKEISQYPTVVDFRDKLLRSIDKLKLIEEEKAVVNRCMQLSNNNRLWESLSNALSPVMVQTSSDPIQSIFNIGITVSRTVMSYKESENLKNIEELKVLWDIRKDELDALNELNSELVKCETELYQEYPKLENKHRLREKDLESYFSVLSNEPNKRLRRLLDNYDKYSVMLDYYFNLGNTYIELIDNKKKNAVELYSKAKDCFDEYERRCRYAQIKSIDENLGFIALARLAYEKDLNETEKKNEINIALDNLPNHGAAWLECAFVYANELKDSISAYELLRKGIDEDRMTDKDALAMYAASLRSKISDSQLNNKMFQAIKVLRDVSINSIIGYNLNKKAPKNSFDDVVTFIDATTKLLWWDTRWDNSFELSFDSGHSVDLKSIHLYEESIDDDKMIIKEKKLSYANAKTKEEINNKVDCFSANPNLMHLFFDEMNKDMFVLKDNIDFNKVEDGDWMSMDKICTLSGDDKKDIIEYCQKLQENKGNGIAVRVEGMDTNDSKNISKNVEFFGKKLLYTPDKRKKGDSTTRMVLIFDGLCKSKFTYVIDESAPSRVKLLSAKLIETPKKK